MKRIRLLLKLAVLLVLTASLGACSLFASKSDYDKSRSGKALEVPPDLTYKPGNAALEVPQIAPSSATFSHYSQTAEGDNGQAGVTTAPAATSPGQASVAAAPTTSAGAPGVRIMRDGAVRWLEVDMSPQQLWPRIRDFLEQQGYKIKTDDPHLGVIETGWREYKAESGDGFFSRLLNKLNSTGLRDSYRFRVEPAATPGKTDVFITHHGLREVATPDNGTDIVETMWETRPSDPGLEAEMMQRFLIYLGAGKAEAAKMLAATPAVAHASLSRRDDQPVLLVNEVFPRTWRRTGLALDRMGVVVEDRDRSNGLYFIRLPKDFSKSEDKGWLAGLFSGDKKKPVAERYQLKIEDQGQQCVIRVLDQSGEPDKGPVAEQILKHMLVYLK